jgi:hypothetical protein
MWTYRLRYVRCGKRDCHCEDGIGHGPYWYGYEHRGGRVYSRYFGKRPTSTFSYPGVGPSEPPKSDRFTFMGRMTMQSALRIFGLTQRPNRETLVARYRVLAMEHHPDHGGETSVMAAINAAYGYLR